MHFYDFAANSVTKKIFNLPVKVNSSAHLSSNPVTKRDAMLHVSNLVPRFERSLLGLATCLQESG